MTAPDPAAARLETLLDQIRACRICAAHLPLGPRPVLRAAPSARIAIVGQAPGTRVHETGIPWHDASGKRLRDWLDLDDEVFYDDRRIAITPMGFCYPGRLPQGGDRPPRPECASTWHAELRRHLPRLELTLLVGSYAQKFYLGRDARRTMGETVRHWHDCGPAFFPMPHPSWRVTNWLKQNPWFEREAVPVLRQRVRDILAGWHA